ncbi:MAG: hypothetical protein C0594_08575, partial [Marinilabiliales bacterium]
MFKISQNLGLSVAGDEPTIYSTQTFSSNPSPKQFISNAAAESKEDNYYQIKRQTIAKKLSKVKFAAAIGGFAGSIPLAGGQYGLFTLKGSRFSAASPKAMGVSNYWIRGISGSASGEDIGISIERKKDMACQFGINIPRMDMKAYGYMNNPNLDDMNSEDNEVSLPDKSNYTNILSDYYTEREMAYTHRDKTIGIPFNNADNFVVLGEGIGGGFKIHHDQIGHFYPAWMKNISKLRTNGTEMGFSPNDRIKFGMDFAWGRSVNSVKNWKGPNSDDSEYYKQFSGDSERFFRFNNDMGGTSHFDNVSWTKAPVLRNAYTFALPGVKKIEAEVTEPMSGLVDKGRSSYITYRTGSNMSGEECLSCEEQSADIIKLTQTAREDENNELDDRIMEMAITNQNGSRFVYGIPVFNRNEKRLRFGTRQDYNYSNQDVRDYQIHEYTTQDNIDDENNMDLLLMNNEHVVGEVKRKPYARSFLITQITGPNYVDVNETQGELVPDGPSQSDFGAWTKFRYRKKYGFSTPDGEAGEWYRYRAPYTGFFHIPGSIADKRDNLLVVHGGEKEVYYLKAIETKTHIAFFITDATDGSEDFAEFIPESLENRDAILDYLDGSAYNGSDTPDESKLRLDGLGAAEFAENENSISDNRIEKLERIVMYSKERFEKPTRIVRFAYEYKAWPKIPNSKSEWWLPGNEDVPNTGKLTLTKLLFEYEGIERTRVSPYEFEYEYKPSEDFGQNIVDKYSDIANFKDNVGNETPDYDSTPDMWGNHLETDDADNPDERSYLRPWVPQYDIAGYDPAAWKLKQITLPSGGEILIQYEAKDYQYVHDKVATAMVSLTDDNNGMFSSYDPDADKYYLDLSDIGISTSEEIDEFVELLNDEIVGEKTYFKFLYAMDGGESPGLDPTSNPTSEYIRGWSYVKEATREPGTDKVYLKLGLDNDTRLWHIF